jgi:hypothetical protein
MKPIIFDLSKKEGGKMERKAIKIENTTFSNTPSIPFLLLLVSLILN